MEKNPIVNYFEAYVTLSNEEKEWIRTAYRPMHLAKKELLFQQGEICKLEAFVLSGTLRVYHVDARGLEHVLNFALPKWWVGDINSFYNGTPAFQNVQALEDSELLVIDPERKEELFRKIPKLERVFRIVIQKHLASWQNRFLATVSEKAKQRYKNLVERIPMIEQLVPQHQIASYLGILPESLSRLKKRMIESKK